MNSLYLIKDYFLKKRLSVLVGILALIVVDLMNVTIPRIIKLAVDDLTLYHVAGLGLLRYALYIVLLAIFIGIFRFVWRHYLIGLARDVEEGLRNRLFAHIQTLSASYFTNARTGDLMAHATNDIMHIRMAVGMGLVAFVDTIVMSIATIGSMAYINLRLTVLVLLPMPMIIIASRFFGSMMHTAYGEVQATFSEVTELVRERFAGIRIVKAYTGEADAIQRLDAVSRKYIDKNMQLVRITGIFFPMMAFFAELSLTLVLYLGGRQTIYGGITPGDFVAFVNYLGLLTWPMMAIGWLINLIQRGKASLDRIQAILTTEAGITDAPDAVPIPAFNDRIVLENVDFRYNGTPVLRGVNLVVKKGETLGIVGPPGSGKTSLIQLIPRLFDISGGRVSIDGIDVRRARTADLRGLIAYVPQEPFLFAGTIRENITFDRPDISEAEMAQAAEDAAVLETIREFPKGFDTVVGEKGVMLSGGQKQRIALARALLRDAPVLILDDPISQVDTETGDRIIRTIRKTAGQIVPDGSGNVLHGKSGAEKAEKTIIIISHRLAALRSADRIITLKDGEITEAGTHDDLLERNGYYARTFRLQEIDRTWDRTWEASHVQ